MKVKLLLRLGLLTAFCSTVFSSCNFGSGLPAFASSVRRVTITEATGSEEPVSVELSPGYGVNFSFLATGETVEKVWFDNPAVATLDADGCLSGLVSEKTSCSSQGAAVLHVRRINPLNFPNLPKTNSTLLTAVTNGKTGRRLYVFRLVLGGASSSYHTVEVVPDKRITTVPKYRSAVDGVTDWQVFNRGLNVALEKRWIRKSQPLYKRVQNFLIRVKGGEQIDSAASASGISMKLVERLEELGRNNDDVTTPPVINIPQPIHQSPTVDEVADRKV